MKLIICNIFKASVIIALLTGCSETRKMVVECNFPTQDLRPGPALVAQEYGEISSIPLNAVQFISPSLTERVAVQNLKARRTATKTVEVNARMINCSDEPMTLGVRAHFMDSDQVSAEKESAWQNVIIQPRAIGNYRESSLKTNIDYYLLELRDGG